MERAEELARIAKMRIKRLCLFDGFGEKDLG
jgi:hypothetical protein